MTFLSAKNWQNVLFENEKDYFPLVAKGLGDVLVKKSVAGWQHSTEIDSPEHIFHLRLSLDAPEVGKRIS